MVEPVAVVAMALDAAIGWPASLYARLGHPVGGFARFIGWSELVGNRPASGFAARRVFGAVTLLLLVGGTAALGHALQDLIGVALGQWAWIGLAVLAWPALAQRSLAEHVRPVAEALGRGDLPMARGAVARIVGRDTATLDEAGIARAAIESLAESFCDGVVAPLVWLVVGGLPGIWAYKAINTADSLIGHREERWRAFGWAAARVDDVANFVPARLAALLLCVAGKGGWRVLMRDRRCHASPNGGWPEAAMAGALGVALAGPVAYDGVVHVKPWIGREGRTPDADDVRRALAVYRGACAMLWLIAGGLACLR